MDVMVRLNVPRVVYQFYKGAAAHVSQRTTESLMEEVLSAYAKALSREVCEGLEKEQEKNAVPRL